MSISAHSQGAAEALAARAVQEVGAIPGLNRAYEGAPLQAAFPYALIEAGPETDWSHKSGEGREVRLAVTIRDKGEQPARVRALVREAEAVLAGIEGAVGGWRIVSLRFLRSRTVSVRSGEYAGVSEYRARMLAAGSAG